MESKWPLDSFCLGMGLDVDVCKWRRWRRITGLGTENRRINGLQWDWKGVVGDLQIWCMG